MCQDACPDLWCCTDTHRKDLYSVDNPKLRRDASKLCFVYQASSFILSFRFARTSHGFVPFFHAPLVVRPPEALEVQHVPMDGTGQHRDPDDVSTLESVPYGGSTPPEGCV